MNIIDAHVHVWIPDREHYPFAQAFEQDRPKPLSFTPEELFFHARPCSVGRVVLIQMSYYGFDNSYMLDSMERYRHIFSGVAVIDHNAERPQDEMRRLKQRGVRGFRIAPAGHPDTWLDAPGYAAMWQCGAEEGLAMCPLVDPNALPSIGRMCARFPETPVVIDHMARIGAGGVIRDADIAALAQLAAHRRTHVKISAFYALGKKQYPYLDLIPMIRRLFEAYGPQRLMWASDSPFQVSNGHTYSGSVELVRDHLGFLSAEDREWLLSKTAERVFF